MQSYSLNQEEKDDAEEKPYNPFIHGTNSSILPVLVKTDMQLLSPIDMIRDYKIAPICGEFTQGGYTRATSRGMPSFGRVSGGRYSLGKITSDYTNHKPSKTLWDWDFRQPYKYAFGDINLFLIELVRDIQSGEKEIIKKIDIELLSAQVNAVIQMYYLILLMGKEIHPDLEYIRSLDTDKQNDLFDAVYTHLNFKSLLEKIKETGINIEQIYKNPDEEGLSQLETLLELPSQSIIKSGPSEVRKEIVLEQTKIFIRKHPEYEVDREMYDPLNYVTHLVQGVHLGAYSIPGFIENYARGYFGDHFLGPAESYILENIEALEERLSMIESVVQDCEEIEPLDYESDFIKNPIPMVFVCENAEKIVLHSESSGEYRAVSPLKIGVDIQLIATDTEENRSRLIEFFDEKNISVEVVLYEYLTQAYEESIKGFDVRPLDEGYLSQESEISEIGLESEEKRESIKPKLENTPNQEELLKLFEKQIQRLFLVSEKNPTEDTMRKINGFAKVHELVANHEMDEALIELSNQDNNAMTVRRDSWVPTLFRPCVDILLPTESQRSVRDAINLIKSDMLSPR